MLFSFRMKFIIWLVIVVEMVGDCKMEIYSDSSSQDWQILTAGGVPLPHPPPGALWIPMDTVPFHIVNEIVSRVRYSTKLLQCSSN